LAVVPTSYTTVLRCGPVRCIVRPKISPAVEHRLASGSAYFGCQVVGMVN